MKSTETKREFVRLRGEGLSYGTICEQLHIGKSTCIAWEKELADEIGELRRAGLEELRESYGMTKEARIKRLGETLTRINDALDRVDFSTVDPVKLLDFKLKYMDALKQEHIGTAPDIDPDTMNAKGILAKLTDLLNRVRAGDITTEQAHRESMVLSDLLRAYDTVEVKAKLDELETMIEGRNAG